MYLPVGLSIVVAVVALLAAGAIWFVLVRPVEQQTAAGVIVGRQFAAEETQETTIPRAYKPLERVPQTRTYKLPDRYVYDIILDGRDQPVRYWARVVEGHNMEVGQRVRVVYVQRGIPPFWAKLYVERIEPLQ